MGMVADSLNNRQWRHDPMEQGIGSRTCKNLNGIVRASYGISGFASLETYHGGIDHSAIIRSRSVKNFTDIQIRCGFVILNAVLLVTVSWNITMRLV